jgi:hypothetical protein
MAKVGRLRLLDDRLVVEGIGGELLAEIEPDDHMRINVPPLALLGAAAADVPVLVSVTWRQVLGQRGYIDAEAIDVDEVPRLP